MKWLAIGALLLCSAAGFAQQQEVLLYDGFGASSNSVVSWRDARASLQEIEAPAGGAIGIRLAATNIVVTKIEAFVELDDTSPETLDNTKFEFTWEKDFKWSMYLAPEFSAEFGKNEVNLKQDGGRWLLSITPPPFAINSRVLSVRSCPDGEGPFTKLRICMTQNRQPGSQAAVTDRDGNEVSTQETPAFRIWGRNVSPLGVVSYETSGLFLNLAVEPGYQMGCSATGTGPWDWETGAMFGQASVDTSTAASGYFVSRLPLD